MKKFEQIFRVIDNTNEKLGGVLCYILIAMMLIQVLEVVMRYIFSNPTTWAWDVNGQLFAGSGILAGAYAMLHDAHIRLDVLHRGWNQRRKVIVELITAPFILIALCVVIWKGAEMAWWSWKTNEHVHSYLAPILWPVKTCFPIAAFLIFIQAISKYNKMFTSLRKPQDVE